MQELTPLQTAVLERLIARGFQIVAFPLYASAIGVRRGSFAALLMPVEGGGLCVFGEPYYLIDGNFSVPVQRSGMQQFVWKSQSAEATPDLMAQLRRFSEELERLLWADAQ